MTSYARAMVPEDLSCFFFERFNAGDADGVAALYAKDAVLANPPGQLTSELEAIRRFYAERLSVSARPTFAGEIQPSLVAGDLAVTSTLYETSGTEGVVRTASLEVARRQPDGSWLWVIDLPNALRAR